MCCSADRSWIGSPLSRFEQRGMISTVVVKLIKKEKNLLFSTLICYTLSVFFNYVDKAGGILQWNY